ncbi:hypothetical protein [Robbsia sp. KACC 23696]|uniref:hypothetical protein n=1 Tax=Robbsia sp. KACC 23696 TaxID=3149231 RepID=UPI00325BE2B5
MANDGDIAPHHEANLRQTLLTVCLLPGVHWAPFIGGLNESLFMMLCMTSVLIIHNGVLPETYCISRDKEHG